MIVQWSGPWSLTTTLSFLKFWLLMTDGRRTGVHFNVKSFADASIYDHK